MKTLSVVYDCRACGEPVLCRAEEVVRAEARDLGQPATHQEVQQLAALAGELTRVCQGCAKLALEQQGAVTELLGETA